MIDATAYMIVTALGGLTVLFILALYTGQMAWPLKAVMAVSAFAALLMLYVSLVASLGWPVVDELPRQFRFIWSEIQEPTADDPGRIYIWYEAKGWVRPRSVSIPYSKPLHEKLQQAKDRVTKGEDVFLEEREAKPLDPNLPRGNQIGGDLILDFVPPPSTLPQKSR